MHNIMHTVVDPLRIEPARLGRPLRGAQANSNATLYDLVVCIQIPSCIHMFTIHEGMHMCTAMSTTLVVYADTL